MFEEIGENWKELTLVVGCNKENPIHNSRTSIAMPNNLSQLNNIKCKSTENRH